MLGISASKAVVAIQIGYCVSDQNPPGITSCKQGVLARLGIADLVDHEAHATLGDDVRHAVADLDCHHRLGCRDAQHQEQIDHRVGAPTDHSCPLGYQDLSLDNRVGLAVRGLTEAHQKLVDDV